MRLYAALLLLALLPGQAPAQTAGAYDLIFKTGTLAGIPATDELHYERVLDVAGNAEASQGGTGQIGLTFEADDVARLTFHQGERYRTVGNFPASVGNPVIMYFVETVVRDVAANTGGSPFYIRNRVKDALVEPAEIVAAVGAYEGREIAVQQITLVPFLNDPNRDKMQGYADLKITVTVSEDVPGWYSALVASAEPADGSAPVYRNALTLLAGGSGQ